MTLTSCQCHYLIRSYLTCFQIAIARFLLSFLLLHSINRPADFPSKEIIAPSL
uniref:Uncharacterized protein n=1 Tax=Proteus vulgaris TaxID=585 RepID=Q8KK38_PROVU|nr:hypothetical protein [Proteus vulgaris]